MAEPMTKVKRPSHSEDAQEHREASDVWLWAAFAAISVSMLFHGTGKREDGHFVGQWVAPLLLFGVYNKLVKIGGSDRTS